MLDASGVVKGAASFAELLHQNKSLHTLCLLDGCICKEGTQELIVSGPSLKKQYCGSQMSTSHVLQTEEFIFIGILINTYHTMDNYPSVRH